MADVQSQAAFDGFDDAKLKGVHWLWSFIAGLGDYLDAGSIVAGGASLALWVKYFHLNPSIIGIIAAFSSNGISTAVGAFFAGRLGDRYGRKFIFMFDLLLYALGALVIIVSVNSAMLIIGYMIMGLAVGADVPTSWSLIAEFSPRKHRGKMMGITNIMWYVGPIVILLLSLALRRVTIVVPVVESRYLDDASRPHCLIRVVGIVQLKTAFPNVDRRTIVPVVGLSARKRRQPADRKIFVVDSGRFSTSDCHAEKPMPRA